MKKEYVVSIDQGTTSCRTLIFDLKGKLVASAQEDFSQIFPKSGWVEHNAEEIWTVQYQTILDAIENAGIKPSDILTIGITNQRETTVLWNKTTGKPVYNAIVWQDKRTSKRCSLLAKGNERELIVSSTGLVPDSYFSASKIEWILENIVADQGISNEDLAFGTIDSWLLWKLTGHRVHATDVSNASRTMLFNIKTLSWDEELLSIFSIPDIILPTVMDSCSLYGETSNELFDNANIPITGVLGDQQAALFGQECTEMGMAKNTYGTGCFILANCGQTPFDSRHGLLSTIAWKIGDDLTYAIEGSVFNAGSAIDWFVDELGLAPNVSYTSAMAESLTDSDGVVVIPAFSGLGSPFWDMNAKGAILGLSRKHRKEHIIRAVLESLAFRSADVLKAMEKDAGFGINLLKVDGGVCRNNFLMQFQADILGIEVSRPEFIESTALGAAKIAANYFNEMEAIESQNVQVFKPNMAEDERDRLYKYWLNSVQKILGD